MSLESPTYASCKTTSKPIVDKAQFIIIIEAFLVLSNGISPSVAVATCNYYAKFCLPIV